MGLQGAGRLLSFLIAIKNPLWRHYFPIPNGRIARPNCSTQFEEHEDQLAGKAAGALELH